MATAEVVETDADTAFGPATKDLDRQRRVGDPTPSRWLKSHVWNYTVVISTTPQLKPEMLPCPRCGDAVVLVRVNRDRDWMRLNPDPDPSGEAILLGHGTRAIVIPEEERLAVLENRTRRDHGNAEIQARRYRDHAKTCRGYRIILPRSDAVKSTCSVVVTDQLQRLHEVRIQLLVDRG